MSAHCATSVPARRHRAHLKSETRRYDLFIGIPAHRVPTVVEESGLTAGGTDGWIAVDRRTLATPYPNVYAIGDCADAPVPRAGVFAETAARTVADHILATIHRTRPDRPVRRPRVVLHRVRGRPGRQGGRRLPLRPGTDRAVLRTVASARRGESAFAASRIRRWFAATRDVLPQSIGTPSPVGVGSSAMTTTPAP
jgi:sulfide:quinone oxidoreductase